jgi:hypothetical protein
LTFPPFDQPPQVYQVSGPAWPWRWDRVRYRLTGENAYEFYVRRWGNTVTWTYGKADERPQVRAGVVDSLAERLSSMAG